MPFTAFRLASTVRRPNPKTREYEDGPTNFFNVTAFRALGANVGNSLKKGDPVFVYGRMRVNQWTRSDNIPATSVEIDAYTVGHDLTWGTTELVKVSRAQVDQTDRLSDEASPVGARRAGVRWWVGRGERRVRGGAAADGAGAPGWRRAGARRGLSARQADSGVGAVAVSLVPMAEFIYVMSKARKAHGDKVILDDVTLSFYPGRQDRRRRAQRRRQVDRAEDHGRAGPAVQR